MGFPVRLVRASRVIQYKGRCHGKGNACPHFHLETQMSSYLGLSDTFGQHLQKTNSLLSDAVLPFIARLSTEESHCKE